MAEKAQSEESQFAEYAVEGVRFFLSIRQFIDVLAKDYEFIPDFGVAITVYPFYECPYSVKQGDELVVLDNNGENLIISKARSLDVVALRQAITIYFIMEIVLAAERLTHDTTWKVLNKVALQQQEGETNKQWIRRVLEACQTHILKAAQKSQ